MGIGENEPDWNQNERHEAPPMRVDLTQGFWMQETEVTQMQWDILVSENRSTFKGDYLPVQNVTWHDAIFFCNELSKKIDGWTFSLPTEAQWEYACRAGTITRYYHGDLPSQGMANANSDGINYNQPIPGKNFPPNPWGLYDMYGNVAEWCIDEWTIYPKFPSVDWVAPELKSSFQRVRRGGSFNNHFKYIGSASRQKSPTNSGFYPPRVGAGFGFRVVGIPDE